jgi:hypothetical protein
MYTAIVQQQGEWWIGWIKDIPGVNCQERTYDELLDSLRGCLKDILEHNWGQAISVAAGMVH